MTIRCVSIDDEPLARQGLSLALTPYNDFELIAQYGAADDYLEALSSGELCQPDVLFVDIEMPRINGFELVKQHIEPLPLVVFITAYDQYAVQAFEQQALDYVLKPIAEERFEQVIERIRASVDRPKNDLEKLQLRKKIELLRQQLKVTEARISVKTDKGYFRMKVSDIIFIESVGDHVCIHLADKQLITRNTLKFYGNELAEHGFCQVHKSRLVNAKQVAQFSKLRFNDHLLLMSNGEEVRVSRRYKSVLDNFI